MDGAFFPFFQDLVDYRQTFPKVGTKRMFFTRLDCPFTIQKIFWQADFCQFFIVFPPGKWSGLRPFIVIRPVWPKRKRDHCVFHGWGGIADLDRWDLRGGGPGVGLSEPSDSPSPVQVQNFGLFLLDQLRNRVPVQVLVQESQSGVP